MADMVVVTCYDRTETIRRDKAIAKYLEGMACSEGSERERYEAIYFQLLAGCSIATDR